MSDMDIKDILSMIPENLQGIYKKAQQVLARVVADVEKASTQRKTLLEEVEALKGRKEEAERLSKNCEVEFAIKKEEADKKLTQYIQSEQEHITGIKNDMRAKQKVLEDTILEVKNNNTRLKEAVAANEGLIETRNIVVADLEAIVKEIQERLKKYAV